MKIFRDAGGRCLVVLTMTAREGRDVSAFRRISEAADVHIVCATGLYQLDYHPEGIPGMTYNDIEQPSVENPAAWPMFT